MKIDNNKIITTGLNLLLILAVLISILGFIRDFKNTFKCGGSDLRNRIVGARLLSIGEDPYHFKWSQDKPIFLLDPGDNPSNLVSKVTVTPTVLLMYSIMAKSPYKIQRLLWLLLQWCFLVISIAIFSRNTNSNVKSKIIWILGLLFISGSYFWRLHVETGQTYILYVFLISLAYRLIYKESRCSSILSGFLIGFGISLRPPIISMVIPMIIFKKWKLVIGSITGTLAGLLSPLLLTDFSIWEKYISAMNIWVKVNSGLIKASNVYYPIHRVEGMDFLPVIVSMPLYNSSLQYIFATRFIGIKLSPTILAVSLVLTLFFISFFLFRIRTKKVSESLIFLVGIVLVFISEFFIPVIRYPYNNIIWLVPLSLIIINCDSVVSWLNPAIILLLIGLFFSSGFTWAPKSFFISDYAILFYSISATFWFLKKAIGEEE